MATILVTPRGARPTREPKPRSCCRSHGRRVGSAAWIETRTTTSSSEPAARGRCSRRGSPRTRGSRVLLLEAGGEAEADEISIPAAFSTLFKTRWDWNYSTTEQKQLHGAARLLAADEGARRLLVDERDDLHPRQPRRLRRAGATQYGATGWGYDDVLPYFIRSEGNTRLGGPFHGQDGPLHVEDRRYTHELTDAVGRQRRWRRAQAHRRLQRRRAGGRRALPGHLQEGTALVDGQRAYLEPALDRPNLTVRDRRARDPGRRSRASRAVGVTYRRERPRAHRRAPAARWSSAAARSTARSC